jgi:nucleotide-binding universal stress UspA family protein
MYTKIMVPVDLAHVERLDKALRTAADLANHYGIPACYVGVTTETPGPLGHTPAEFAAKLEEFGRQQSAEHGHTTETRAYASHDLTIDLDDTLLKAVHETGSDLVVMASHIPDLIDYVWPSNGGKIAEHSDASVFVVR